MDEQPEVHSTALEDEDMMMSAITYNIFNELRLQGELCDVVIQVEEVEFKAHKTIMCGCSHYFR